MNDKSLNINILNATSTIGSILQGDNDSVRVNVALNQEVIEHHFNIAKNSLKELAKEFEKNNGDINAVLSELIALKNEFQDEIQDVEKGREIFKAIRDTFSWAYPVIKTFIKAIWPVLLVNA